MNCGSSTRVTLSSPHSAQGFKMPRWPLANPRGWSWSRRVEETKSCVIDDFIRSDSPMLQVFGRKIESNLKATLSLKGNSQTTNNHSECGSNPSKINAFYVRFTKGVIPFSGGVASGAGSRPQIAQRGITWTKQRPKQGPPSNALQFDLSLGKTTCKFIHWCIMMCFSMLPGSCFARIWREPRVAKGMMKQSI